MLRFSMIMIVDQW